jgi:hypothetical protein
MMKMGAVAILTTCVLAGGCSSLTTKEIDKPVVVQSMKDKKWFWESDRYESVLLTPERRQILIKYDDHKNDIICSEAPTDAGLKIDTLIKASLEGEVPASGSGKATFNNQSNTANIALHNQLQTIKFMTAANHAICNLYLNGAIEKKEYARLVGEIIKQAAVMAPSEAPLFYEAISKAKTNSSRETGVVPSEPGAGGSETGKSKAAVTPTVEGRAVETELYRDYFRSINRINPTGFDVQGLR